MTDMKVGIAGAAATLTLIAVIFTAVFCGTELPASRSTEAIAQGGATSAPAPSASRALPAPEASPPQISAAQDEFILREYCGVIGVFRPGAAEPFLTLDVPVDSLRAADAEKLRSGMAVNGDTELAQIVEDFDG